MVRWQKAGRRALLGVLMLATLFIGSGTVQAQPTSEVAPAWVPFIAIVYPDGGPSNLAQSTQVNISVWPKEPVRCDQPPDFGHDVFTLGGRVGLYVARGNEPVALVATPERAEIMLRRDGDHSFPSLEFNNVSADLRTNPTGQYRFVFGRSVWVHALDARTYYPRPVLPTGYAEGMVGRSPNLQSLDARIQVVWPHDGHGHQMPVDKARYVNVAVEVFEHGTLKAVRSFPAERIVLYSAKGNEGLVPAIPLGQPGGENLAPPQVVTYEVDGNQYSRYVFNNIAVQPGQPVNFAVQLRDPNPLLRDVPPYSYYSTIWTHAADARTYLPNPQPPKYGGYQEFMPEVLGCSVR